MSTIIITGASKGIGLAVALNAARKGYDICITYKSDKKAADKAVKKLKKITQKVVCVKADISNIRDIKKIYQKINKLSRLEILVNNAATNVFRTPFEDIKYKDLKKIFEINYFGYFYCSQLAFKIFKKQNKNLNKSIINLSSQAANFGGNMFTHYAPTKSALNTLTKGLSREAAKYNIRVNAISPGIIMTEGMLKVNKSNLENIKKTIPLNKIGTPEEVAEAIMQVAELNSSYITGSIIPVGGGR
ncbi:MAG: SDR family oxidoreductase [Pelagibacteraceae bacterium]|nr:SDR family oxidoreductase [Pelagibacteraceae bacterium]MCI5078824.1 SDR family oxidoreductase [Pelagibacteraceae bacterium]